MVITICSHHLSLIQYLMLRTDNLTKLWMLCKSSVAGIHIGAFAHDTIMMIGTVKLAFQPLVALT